MKKNVKNLWALVLTLAMVLSTNFTLPAQAAETADSSLTYELDFSDLKEYSTEMNARGLKNSARAAANGTVIDQHYINSNVLLTTTTEHGVKALDFNGKNGFLVESTDGSAFGSKDISIEMWIYKENTSKTGRLFNLMQKKGSGTILEWYYLGAPNNANSIKLATNGTENKYKFADYHYVDDWNHVVVTRSFDETNNSAETKLYSNGVLKNTYTNTGLADFEAPQAIWVGNYDGTNDIGTELASLKVYNKALTLDEIDSKFDAEKADYGVGLRDDRQVYELDFSGLDETDTAQGNRGLSFKNRADKYVGAHTVLAGTPLTTEVKNGVRGLNFNGKNGVKIASGTNADGAFVSQDISIEMWIYKKNEAASGPLVKLNGSTLQMYYEGGLPDAANKMQIIPHGSDTTKRNYTFSDYHYVEDWEHIVLTRTYDTDTSATTKLYSNGVLRDTYPDTGLATYSKANAIELGNYAGTGNISTLVGDFRVFDAVLSPEDVAERYDLQKEEYGVADRDVLTYDLDFSSYATNGTFDNASTTRGIDINAYYNPNPSQITVEEIEGVNALKLNDNGGFIIRSEDGSAFGSKDLTIEMWAYKYDGYSKGNLFNLARGTGSTAEMEMYFMGNENLDTASSVKIAHSVGGKSNFENPNFTRDYEVDAWQHIVYTRTLDDENTATTNVYVNGQNVKTYTNAGVTYETPGRLYVGDYDDGDCVIAAIAALKVYNKALPADEIQDKFLEEAPNYNNVTYYANDAEIEKLTADMTAVKSSVWVLNTENKAVDMKAFAAVYQDDVLVKVVPAEETVAANDVWNFDIPVEDIEVTDNTEIKTFIWTKDGMKPLYVNADQEIGYCL